MSDEAMVPRDVRPLPPIPEFLLPPLPPITDKELCDAAITHTSVYCMRRDGRELDMSQRILDYEKLEHVGDALLGSCVVVLLHELYPNLRQGPASRLKDDLVSNSMLAQLADRYGISDQLQASRSAYYVTKIQVKTRGSLFESWIAGVYYSYLKNGAPKPDSVEGPNLLGQTPESASPLRQGAPQAPFEPQEDAQLKSTSLNEAVKASTKGGKTQDEDESSSKNASDSEDYSDGSSESPDLEQYPTMLPSQPEITSLKDQGTIKPEFASEQSRPTPASALNSRTIQREEAIKTDDSPRPRTYGEAFDYLYSWLGPLFTPIARYAMQHRLDEHARLNTAFDLEKQDDEDHASGGSKLALDVYAKNTWDITPVYEAVRPEKVKGIWVTSVTLTQPDGTVLKGSASRGTKKLGYNLAAYQVLKQLQIV